MAAPSSKELLKWDSRRRLGRPRYCLVYGALLWGVPASGAVALLKGWQGKTQVQEIAMMALVWAATGFWAAWIRWERMEERRRLFLESRRRG